MPGGAATLRVSQGCPDGNGLEPEAPLNCGKLFWMALPDNDMSSLLWAEPLLGLVPGDQTVCANGKEDQAQTTAEKLSERTP